MIKTTRAKSKEIIRIVKSVHRYEVPEIIFLPIAKGERNYMNWLRNAVKLVVLAVGLAGATPRGWADPFDDLVKKLGDGDPEVRAEAADGLARSGGPRAQKQFREMLTSSNAERRQVAAVGLLQVSDSEEDVAAVRKLLDDTDSIVRWSAALALGQSGRVEALPWLREAAASDSSESVREAAAEGVKKLEASIPWGRSLAAGYEQSAKLNKPVLAYFSLRGSDYCKKFELGVLQDQAVVDATQEFVPVWIDASRGADEVRKLDVRGTPTILILDRQGNEMTRIGGLVEKQELLKRLAEARRSKLTFREAKREATKNPANVQANWKVAETYLGDGREDMAEPHLRNVIAHDEANQYGHTDNAMFALGFLLGRKGEYSQGAYCLENLLKRWPGFKDKDKALYCLGLCQLAVGEKGAGQASLNRLIKEFPDSAAAANAKKALERFKQNETK